VTESATHTGSADDDLMRAVPVFAFVAALWIRTPVPRLQPGGPV